MAEGDRSSAAQIYVPRSHHQVLYRHEKFYSRETNRREIYSRKSPLLFQRNSAHRPDTNHQITESFTKTESLCQPCAKKTSNSHRPRTRTPRTEFSHRNQRTENPAAAETAPTLRSWRNNCAGKECSRRTPSRRRPEALL